MLDADFLLRVPRNWMSEVTQRFGVRMRVVDRKAYGRHEVQGLVQLEVGERDPNVFGGRLNRRERVRKDMRKRKMVGGAAEGSPKLTSSTTALTGDEKIGDLVASHPGLRLPLMSYGFCTCCSGSLTLRQNAEVRGLPLHVILEDLNRELAKSA
ncbi:MAG: hypothetical protein WC985_06240 [Thermoplasmata archaeon]